MIEIIAEHSVDTSILPEKAVILDAGCRGFLFADHFRKLGHSVYCVDIDELEGGKYARCAIAGYNGFCGILKTNDPQATSILPEYNEEDRIPCYTLDFYAGVVGVKMFDLIKMDIEGTEYNVIMSLTKPPAKQLSIEFHLHLGVYGKAEMDAMEDHLISLGYKVASHNYTREHGAGFNFWDSLFILE